MRARGKSASSGHTACASHSAFSEGKRQSAQFLVATPVRIPVQPLRDTTLPNSHFGRLVDTFHTAHSELAVLVHQCLDRRLEDDTALEREVAAWLSL